MKRWWSLFVEAVRGSDRDYTVGPVGPALVMLSVPMVLEMAMESLFAVVDVFYVSRVSAAAVATVGVTESMLTIVYTVALGLGIGAMAVVARRIGEKDEEGAAQAAAQAIALGLIVAMAVALVGYFNAETLLRAMGASPLMIESSVGYTKVMFAGNATVTLLFLINAIFRGAGRIEYSIAASSRVSLKLYDLQGRVVRTLVDQDAAAGTFSAQWDGRSDDGAAMGRGIYFARLVAGTQKSDTKIVLE